MEKPSSKHFHKLTFINPTLDDCEIIGTFMIDRYYLDMIKKIELRGDDQDERFKNSCLFFILAAAMIESLVNGAHAQSQSHELHHRLYKLYDNHRFSYGM